MANKFKYLIIGGGMTASAAVESIRTIDKGGTIGLITAESYTPYDRPPLSKGLWQDTDIDDIWRKCKERNVEFFLKRLAVEINPSQKMVIDQQDDTYSYEKLLLATGGTPRRLPFGDGNIIYYRTLADYKRLRELADRYNRFAVEGDIDPLVNGQVIQGFLEQSNVDPIVEISRLIEVQRAYEAGRNLLNAEDERIRNVVRTLTT